MGEMRERVATAIANRRAGRRGAPAVSNVLEILKAIYGGKLYREVMDDADAVIEAMREPTDAMLVAAEFAVPALSSFAERDRSPSYVAWCAAIDAALEDVAATSEPR
jgi:hypothetical protein